MSPAKQVRRHIRATLVAHFQSQGFVGKHPNFQRVEGGQLHLLAIVYDKYGGGFVLEFARMAPGPFEAPWGDTVPQAELEIGHAPLDSRARLVRTTQGNGLNEDFFRFDEPGMDAAACARLVDEVVEKFGQVDEWLRGGTKGENVAGYGA